MSDDSVGGWSKPRTPTPEDQDVLDEVKEDFVKQSGVNPSVFEAVLVSTQNADGKKYKFKVNNGNGSYGCVNVLAPPPDSVKGPGLVTFLLNIKEDLCFK